MNDREPSVLDVDPQSIVALFIAATRRGPTRGLFRHADGRALSYEEACVRVVEAATQLVDMGLRRGDRVVCYLEETIPSALFDLAAALVGIVPVPISPVFSARFLERLVDRVGDNPVFTTPDLAPKVSEAGLRSMCFTAGASRPGIIALDIDRGWSSGEAMDRVEAAAKELSGDSVFMVQPTSGSTGEPKLVLRQHRAFTRYAKFVGREIAPGHAPPSFLAVAALTHAFGLHMFTTALSLGGELCVPNELDTSASLDEVRALNPSVLPMTPRVLRSFHRQHLAKGGGVPVGRMFGPAATVLLTAGAKCEPELLRFVEAEGIDAIEFYGSSEASIVALTPRGARREGWAGRVVADVSARVEPDGELLVRSPGLMLGYVGDEAMTRQAFTGDAHYRTGDIAHLSEDGYLRILGRKRDVFNTCEGSNIYPERIETAIEALPRVRQAMLVGDQRPYLTAFVVLEGDFAAGEVGALSDEEFEVLYEEFGYQLFRLNEGLERVERVIGFMLFGEPFDPECYAAVGPGKVRRDRPRFLSRYATEVARVYSADLSLESVMLVPPRERRFHSEARARGSRRPPPPGRGIRRGPRVSVRIPIEIVAQARATLAETENLSVGGALVRTDERWAPGTLVHVKLIADERPLLGEARVVNHHRAGVSLQFSSAAGDFGDALGQIVARQLAIEQRIERRASRRIEAELRVRVSATEAEREFFIRSVSETGLLIACDPSELGGARELTLVFPDRGGVPISGTVVSHRQNGVAVAFRSLTDTQREYLARLIRELASTRGNAGAHPAGD